MKCSRLIFPAVLWGAVLVALAAGAGSAAAAVKVPDDLVGTWQGKLYSERTGGSEASLLITSQEGAYFLSALVTTRTIVRVEGLFNDDGTFLIVGTNPPEPDKGEIDPPQPDKGIVDPPNPDLGLAQPPDPDRVTSDPPSEVDPPSPDRVTADPPGEVTPPEPDLIMVGFASLSDDGGTSLRGKFQVTLEDGSVDVGEFEFAR